MNAAETQREAADPRLITFVAANAGSGKTKTLIDRVARLLLAEAEPDKILCVTYTRAAAAEMQSRLFERLGGWAVMDDKALAKELGGLLGGEADLDKAFLSHARTLFARALETPGGLKIQTLHAFCEKLLRRFPVEAEVSPGFEVMDDASAAQASAAARDMLARAAAASQLVGDAYARMAIALDHQSFEGLLDTLAHRREALSAYIEAQGGLAGAIAHTWRLCGFEAPVDPEALAYAAMAELDRDGYAAAIAALKKGAPTQQDCAAALEAMFREPDPRFEALTGLLFTAGGRGNPVAWVVKAKVFQTHTAEQQFLLAEQARLETARERVRAARIAEDTSRVLALAQAYIHAYGLEKTSRGVLDFADLVERARKLLSEAESAAWVLYKLDGGIDHILLDEAQDTAPDQWEVVEGLVGEFFAGRSVRDEDERPAALKRSLFVVGDDKQSIYSFQGAAPELMQQKTRAWIKRIEAMGPEAGLRAAQLELTTSFRSAPEVLRLVDEVLSLPDLSTGAPPETANVVRHIAERDPGGCVELWPLEPFRDPPKPDRDAWDPVDFEGDGSGARRLAQAIAAEVSRLLREDAVHDRDRSLRPATPGDVLILVRRRAVLFEEIIRELRRAGVPVAGADRLALSEHLALQDMAALARACLSPWDELVLAAVLKSPVYGFDDDQLYALAYGRKKTLWDTLQARADERPQWRFAADDLRRRRELARTAPPFDFFADLLRSPAWGGGSVRAAMGTRMGSEALDVLDELMAQVIAAEAKGATDLETLLAVFARLDISIKRELEAGQAVRVMTVHAAKGLEAPVVILPETVATQPPRDTPLVELDVEPETGRVGGFLWCATKDEACDASLAGRTLRERKRAEEDARLLYVAMTRARDRLIVCGRIGAKAKEIKGWYAHVSAAFEALGADVHEVQAGGHTALRFGPDPQAAPTEGARENIPVTAEPVWLRTLAPEEAARRFLSPSRLEGMEAAAPAASPLERLGGLGRYRRGSLIHRLLEILPELEPAHRAEAAARLLAREPDLSQAQREEIVAAAFKVLDDTAFAAVFGPGSRAEVQLAGAAARLHAGLSISGRVDRLVVRPDRVLVLDFKTNRPPPVRIEDADRAYVAQMAVYWAVLTELYPGREVEAALVWTDGPTLMAVPHAMMEEALARLAR
ncbi:double-strand break repair helicase AddA [Brevundimonas sp. 2R-24]|uniref:DNA 3'-5' helicase n=1 Tax=Peiella sedimenti TaxID=3061083 RepID=A0ABT8SJQ3_9CAUL|nr:double-strand break repair helicase AddA [Caulobacteraceae bacterium XZ-24]